jgi:UDP-N-acetylbacillosamine N-acetyltransferase
VNKIIIVGAGGHARVVADVIRLSRHFEVAGFIDTQNPDRRGDPFEDSVVLGGDEELAELFAADIKHAAVAIGNNEARARVAHQLVTAGWQLPALVHPGAIIAASVTVGAGTVIFAGAIVNPATRIGAHVILNTGCTVDHDCVIGDGAHIAPGANLAGGVHVGAETLVGVGAAVKPNITIGRNAVIGVGAAVVGNVPDGVTVVGVPARVVK